MSYKPQQQQSFQPRVPWRDKSIIPERTPNSELVNKLYMIVSEGNYLKIKDFIVQNHLSASLRNSNNETLLHIIIKNDTLSKNDKYDLAKLCIDNGAMINGYDVNNITPLHLACERQLKKIVSLLLENGADTDAVDSLNKTPIYYSIAGKNVECPTYNTTRVKSLVENKAIKKDKTLDNLEMAVKEFVSEDKKIMMILNHLRTYMDDFNDVFPQYYKDFVGKYEKFKSGVMSNQEKTTSEKKRELRDKLVEDKKQLIKEYEKITNHNSVIDIKIEAGIENGWSPEPINNRTMSILENIDIDTRLATLKKSIDFSETTINQETVKLIESYISTETNFATHIENRNSKLRQLYVLLYIFIDPVPNNAESMTELDQLFSFDRNRFNGSIDLDGHDLTFDSVKNDYAVNISEEDIPKLIVTAEQIDKMNINDQTLNNILQNPIGNTGKYGLFGIFNYVRNKINAHDYVGINKILSKDEIFFTMQYDFYFDNLEDNLQYLQMNVHAMNIELKGRNYDTLLNILIPKIMLYIINVAHILSKIKQENIIVETTTLNIKNFFKSIQKIYETEWTFVFDEVQTQFFQEMKKIFGKHPVIIDEYTNIVKKSISLVNSVIQNIQKKSSYNFLMEFYGKNINPQPINILDLQIDTLKILQDIRDTIDLPILEIKFPDFDEFEKKYIVTDDDLKNKRLLFENLMIQVNKYNRTNFYTQIKNDAIWKYGFIVPDVNGDPSIDSPADDPNNIKLLVESITNGLSIDGQYGTKNPKPSEREYDESNTSIKYSVVLPTSGMLHIGLIKYTIITYVLQQIYDFLNPPQNGPDGPSSPKQNPPSSLGISPPSSLGISPPSSLGISPPSSLGISPPSSLGISPPSSLGISPPSSLGISPPTSTGTSQSSSAPSSSISNSTMSTISTPTQNSIMSTISTPTQNSIMSTISTPNSATPTQNSIISTISTPNSATPPPAPILATAPVPVTATPQATPQAVMSTISTPNSAISTTSAQNSISTHPTQNQGQNFVGNIIDALNTQNFGAQVMAPGALVTTSPQTPSQSSPQAPSATAANMPSIQMIVPPQSTSAPATNTSRKVPSKPHVRCGKFHAVGTSCQIEVTALPRAPAPTPGSKSATIGHQRPFSAPAANTLSIPVTATQQATSQATPQTTQQATPRAPTTNPFTAQTPTRPAIPELDQLIANVAIEHTSLQQASPRALIANTPSIPVTATQQTTPRALIANTPSIPVTSPPVTLNVSDVRRYIHDPYNTTNNKKVVQNQSSQQGGDLESIKKKIEEAEINLEVSGDKSIIYVIIAHIVNRLLTEYVDDLVQRSVNRVILEMIGENIDRKFYSDLVGKSDKLLLASQIKGYKLNLGKVYGDILDAANSELYQIVQNDIVKPLEDKDLKKENIVRLRNAKYAERTSSKEMCYIVNVEIIELLLNPTAKYARRPNLNNKDSLGQSPIFYAIDLKNTKLVKLLLKNKADAKNLFNRMGYNATQYIINQELELIEDEYYDICDALTSDVFMDFQKANSNNLPVNTNILFPMAIHMINHHFFNISRKYYHKWDYEMHQDLVNKTGIKFESVLPILDTKLDIMEDPTYSVYNSRQKSLKTKLEESNKVIQRKETQKSNLERERMLLNLKREELSIIEKKINKTETEYDKARFDEITKLIAKYEEKIAVEKKNIAILNEKYGDLKQPEPQKPGNLNKDSIGDVVKIYESVFLNVINNVQKNDKPIDYMTYQNLWAKYLENERKKMSQKDQNNQYDYTMFVENLGLYQNNILRKKYKDYKGLEEDLSPVNNFYQKLAMPYIEQYFDLPQDYESINHLLNAIINIIIHIVRRVILVNLYYTIIANILENINSSFKDSTGSYRNVTEKYLNEIVGESNSKLAKYIFDDIPEKLVKNVLNIYREDDPDKDTGDIDYLFGNIINLLTNTTIPIKNDSPLIKNLKDTIFPYYRQYTITAINELKLLIDNYLRYMYTMGQNIDIISTLTR
jgi:ankyrin repeat protein